MYIAEEMALTGKSPPHAGVSDRSGPVELSVFV